MPKLGRTNKLSVTPTKKVSQITCAACGESKKPSEYYVSYNPIHQTARIPYCKVCLKNMISDNNGNVQLDKIKETLQLIDRPFLYSIWKTSLEQEGDTFGFYMKNLAMTQYRKLGYADSRFLPEVDKKLNYNNTIVGEKNNSISHFDVTEEMVLKWGSKHESSEDYYALEQFYNDMIRTNTIETTQDIIYLKKLAVISLKMDKALEDGNYDEAKKLGDLFSKYMADSKFRAMDKSETDKTGGIRNFSAIYAEVEKDGFIPPWEYYRKINGAVQDIVDKTIMHIENFTLRLNRVERMTIPPQDTPRIMPEEIDKDSISEYTEINVDITEDIMETKEDGEL